MSEKGYVIVLSGPSGAGKGTVLSRLCTDSRYAVSLSWTTREPRGNEEDGKAYHFRTNEEFEAMISADGFLEYAKYGSKYYGTPKAFVQENLDNGKDVILEIEVQGASKIKEEAVKKLDCKGIIFIFIAPVSVSVLEQRLRGRATETEEKILSRISVAKEEIKSLGNYDYLVINDELENACENLKTIIDSAEGRIEKELADKFKTANNIEFINSFLEGENKNA